MSINIKDYEARLQGYTNQISSGNQAVNNAERDLLVSQTHLENYENQMKELEKECKELTGKSVSEIETVISNSMNELDKIMAKVSQASSVTDNVNVMTESELMDAMQFGADEE